MIEDELLRKWARLFSVVPDLRKDLDALAAQADTLDASVVEGLILNKLADFILDQQAQLFDQQDRIETMQLTIGRLMDFFRTEKAEMQKQVTENAV
jgi:hypothetical protein